MKRWHDKDKTHREVPDVDAFLAEIIEVSKRHGMSIAHEDIDGNFLVREFNDKDTEWLEGASDFRGSVYYVRS